MDVYLKKMAASDALYWIIGPDYAQTHEEFRYLKEWLNAKGWLESVSEPMDGPRLIKVKGGITIETKSAQYPERLGSVAPDGILVVEAGQCSDEIRRICVERSMQKSAWIVYTGTLEDDENHPRWAWYSECAEEWESDRTGEHGSYRLPSWSNRSIYGSCLRAIQSDPSLVELCPDDNHGEAHSGRLHPEIERAARTLDPYSFDRRIAAKPVGLQFLVYPQLERSRLISFDGTEQIDSFGGIDFGTVPGYGPGSHPTVLAVLTAHPRVSVQLAGEFHNSLWVREVRVNRRDPGDVSWLRRNREELSRKWKISRQHWGTDPNEKFMARSYDAKAVSGSAGSREYRIGLTQARLNADALYFDNNGEGVEDAYNEARRVHRRKTRQGQIVLVRDEDDLTAAIENAVELSDGLVKHNLTTGFEMAKPKYRKRVREMKRV